MRVYLFLIAIFSILWGYGCQDELPEVREYPLIRTLEATQIDSTGATFRCQVIQEGLSEVDTFGFLFCTGKLFSDKKFKVVIQDDFSDGYFEARVNHNLAGGISYSYCAFAKYNGKTLYGNLVTFESKGSTHSPWSQTATSVHLPGWHYPYAAICNNEGLILFQNSSAYLYNPLSNEITKSLSYPVSGSSRERFASANLNGKQYVLSDIDNKLYQLESAFFSEVCDLPFQYDRLNGYMHCFAFSERVYIISNSFTIYYDPNSNNWHQGNSLPEDLYAFMGGVELGGSQYLMASNKDIWKYDPSLDHWSKITNYPGKFKNYIISFAFQDKLYFGFNYRRHLPAEGWMEKTFWVYDLVSQNWSICADFPVNIEQTGVFFFPLKGKLYIGFGYEYFNIWEFDPV